MSLLGPQRGGSKYRYESCTSSLDLHVVRFPHRPDPSVAGLETITYTEDGLDVLCGVASQILT